MRAQPALLVLLKLAAIMVGAAAIALLHHGHIAQFLAQVQQLASKRLQGSLRKANWRVRPSFVQA